MVLAVAVGAGLAAVAQPAIGVGGAAVALCCWYAWSRPVFGLALVSFASFVALAPAGFLPAVTVVKALAVLFVVIWLLQRGRAPSGQIPAAFVVALAGFAIWTTLSVVWASDQTAALDVVSRVAQLIAITAVGIAVMQAPRRRRDGRRSVRRRSRGRRGRGAPHRNRLTGRQVGRHRR